MVSQNVEHREEGEQTAAEVVSGSSARGGEAAAHAAGWIAAVSDRPASDPLAPAEPAASAPAEPAALAPVPVAPALAAPSFKRRVYLCLEDPLSAGFAGKAVGLALVALIVINALLVGTTGVDLDTRAVAALYGFSMFSTAVFGVEYCCRVWVADLAHPELSPVRARVRYVLSLMGIVDLLAFLPALAMLFLPVSRAVADAVHIVRLVRLIKISRYMRGLHAISRVFSKRRHEIVAAFMVLALVAIASSVLMYQAEHAVQPEVFDSVLTGLYWAVTTMTSTGYGDVVPVTTAGRLIGIATMVVSIGVVAIPAGIFSAGFIEEFRERDSAAKESAVNGLATTAPASEPVKAEPSAGAELVAKVPSRKPGEAPAKESAARGGGER